jgi:DNA polymerase-3 subunit gamma/tau
VALALYRKYRPKNFAELIGQEHITEPLSQALRTGRLHHAYLFSGPRGCGKTSSARILARSLNCEKGPTPDPCGECESCRALSNDGPGSIDVIEIDAASHGGVDDARDLRERAFFTPIAGRFKIYIIDEAHMVSSAGFNALLKLVEEPPEYVKFVFATTEPEKVLPTIKSRTHHYPFRLYPPSVVRPYLERLCAAEGVTVEPAVFPLVVRAGGGSMRDSLSVLDQLIAGAGPDGVGYARAVALLGVTDAALLDELCDALAAGDGAAAFQIVDQVMDAGHDPRRFASDLLERLRDLIVLQQVPDAATKGLLDAPADQLDRMAVQASQLGPATLTRCAEIVHNGLVEMRGTASPRLLLELVCARMLLPGADDSSDALLHRLERMERRLGAADGAASPATPPPPADPVPADPAPVAASKPSDPPPAAAAPPSPVAAAPPSPAAAAAPSPAPAAPAGTLDAAAIRRVWDEIVATVGRQSKRAAAVVREATVRDVDGDTIVLLFQHTVHATMLASAPQPLLDAIHRVLGGSWQIRCEARDAPSTPAPAPARSVPTGAVPAQPAAPAGRGEADADWPEPARPGGARAEPATPVDEPADELDEVDEMEDARTTAATSEQQALNLLQQSLGAEKIGEVAP